MLVQHSLILGLVRKQSVEIEIIFFLSFIFLIFQIILPWLIMSIWWKLHFIRKICLMLQLLWLLEWILLLLLLRLSLLTNSSTSFSRLSSYIRLFIFLFLRSFRGFIHSAAGVILQHGIIRLRLSLICNNLINILSFETDMVINSCWRHYLISWSSPFCPERNHILQGDR